jgi:hypothetical protein
MFFFLNFLGAKTVNYIRAPKEKQEAARDGNVFHKIYSTSIKPVQ